MSLLYDMMRPRVIQTLALLLAISYIGVASRRWRPAMLFDASLLALLLSRPYPALLAFVCWLIGVRWVRAWATWVALSLKLDTFGGHTAAIARFLLPACDVLMSSGEVVQGGSRTSSIDGSIGSSDAVLADAHQVNGPEPIEIEPASELGSLRNMSRKDLVILLAVQRNSDDSYRWSANDITKFVGGTAADVKAVIAAVRGPKSVPTTPASVPRPKGGW